MRTGEEIVTAPTGADIERVRREVSLVVGTPRIAMAQSRELPRTAGPFCRWRPLLDGCTEGQTATEILG